MSNTIPRRLALQGAFSLGAAGLASSSVAVAQTPAALSKGAALQLTRKWDKTFTQSKRVAHRKVTFTNRYGITLAGDLYQPKGASGKQAALVVCGPFGAVKEQSSGLYAQTMAERGFVTLAFDGSFTGESGGEPRNVASPDINSEDFMAAVDFIGLQHPSEGGEPQFMVDCYDYYGTPRGYHPRAVNSGNAWTITTPLSFMNMPILTYIKEISPCPLLIVHGEKAHSRYFAETAYAAAAEPKELVIVKGASHVDLYDKVDKIPFDKLTAFFKQHLLGTLGA